MSSVEETLLIIHKCASKSFEHLPKRIDQMTEMEYAIYRASSEAVGRLMFIEEVCEKALRGEFMGIAGDLAKENKGETNEKEDLARQLEEVHRDIKQLEKRKDWLKSKIEPLLEVGERIGQVEKMEQHPLTVGADLLKELEDEYGPKIVKRSVNTTYLRELMKDDAELDKKIPRKTRTQIRVGEAYQ